MINIFKYSTLIIFLAISQVSYAETKIAFVNVDKLLREVPQVEKINAKMLERFGPKKAELENLEKEINSLQEDYKKNELVMTDDKLNQLKQTIITKAQVFQQKQAVLQQEVATMRNQEIAVLQKEIREVISNVAKKEKYDLIVSDGILHASDSLNITDKVLADMKSRMK